MFGGGLSFGVVEGVILAVFAVFVFAIATVFVIFEGAVTHAACQHYVGQRVNARQAFRQTRRRLLTMLGVWSVVIVPLGVITIVTLVLGALIDSLGVFGKVVIYIVGVLPVVYLGVRWFFVFQVALLEDKGPLACISRSSQLVKGNWWRVLGFFVIAVIVNFAVSFVNLIPIIGFLAVYIVTPAYVIAQTVLYMDLRLRADGPERFNEEVLAGEIGLAPAEEEGWSDLNPA